MRTTLTILLLAVVCSTSALAQGQRLDITLADGNSFRSARLHSIAGDTLYVGDSLGLTPVPIADITWLRHDMGTHAGTLGTGFCAAGLVVGAVWHLNSGGSLLDIIDLDDDDEHTRYPYHDDEERVVPWRMLVGGLGGALVGAALGSLLPRSETVRLEGAGVEVKLAEVARLLAKR